MIETVCSLFDKESIILFIIFRMIIIHVIEKFFVKRSCEESRILLTDENEINILYIIFSKALEINKWQQRYPCWVSYLGRTDLLIGTTSAAI